MIARSRDIVDPSRAPCSPDALRRWLRVVLDVDVPDAAAGSASSSPIHYLSHAFFESRSGPADCVVWANRGGGKTFYAAVATLLDLVFKPGVDVRILAGSVEQASRMHEHLARLFERPDVAPLIDGRITARALRTTNGGRAEVLAQSQTSVRGTRPQKLRCDEVELFDPDVWGAAQFTTRSRRCGGVWVHGAIECLSTWHVPGGLMARLIEESRDMPHTRRLIRWNAMDVLEACPQVRRCDRCDLEDDCAGRAKREGAAGHVRIADAVSQKRRTDIDGWKSEMLCLRPSRRGAVLPEFKEAVHLYSDERPHAAPGVWAMGMDFGYRTPTVMLWAHIARDGVIRIVDERVVAGVAIDDHIRAVSASRWPEPAWIGADPAGEQDALVTGFSVARRMRDAGLRVRTRASRIENGLRRIRELLAPAAGEPRLYVHERCIKLVRSMREYHYPPGADGTVGAGGRVAPVKDGSDHAVDALRYLIVNLAPAGSSAMQRYW